MRQRFFRTGRALHLHAPRRKAFLHDFADAFFVVHHVDGTSLQRGRGGYRAAHWPAPWAPRAAPRCLPSPPAKSREIPRRLRRRLHFHRPAMFLHDGLANRQSQSSTASGTFRGEERIEDLRQIFRRDPRAVIRKYKCNFPVGGFDSDIAACRDPRRLEIACSALTIRFTNTCCSNLGSASTAGRPSGASS